MYIYINNMSFNNSNNMSNRKEEIIYKNEKDSSILNQGSDYLKNKFKKVEHILTNIISPIPISNTEGFEGILGSNQAMRNTLNSEQTTTSNYKNDVKGKIDIYSGSRQRYNDKTKEYYRFNIEIKPRIYKQAGFELDTDISINVVLPENASKIYKVSKGVFY